MTNEYAKIYKNYITEIPKAKVVITILVSFVVGRRMVRTVLVQSQLNFRKLFFR